MADGGELCDRIRAQSLAVLQGAGSRRRELDEAEYLVIKDARDNGVSWKQIAAALGLNSHQAAQQRHERLERRVVASQVAEKHCLRIRELADAQRENAAQLRDAIGEACEAAVTWRAIGEALGVPHETAFRQFRAGSPVVIVKARQS